MKKNSILRNVILVIFVVCVVGAMAVMGLMDLFNKKDLREVKLDHASPCLTLEHRISGIIPAGKEHYYLGYDSTNSEYYVIRAGKHWYKNNFGAKGAPKNGDTITVKGLAKYIDEYKVRQGVQQQLYLTQGYSHALGADEALVINYKGRAIIMLVGALLFLACGILGIVMKIIKNASKIITILFGALFFVALVFALIAFV